MFITYQRVVNERGREGGVYIEQVVPEAKSAPDFKIINYIKFKLLLSIFFLLLPMG